MAKYKKIMDESFGENFVSAIFRAIGKGIRPIALAAAAKRDPELGKLIKKVEDAKNDVEKFVNKKTKTSKMPKDKQQKLNRGEWPW